MQFSGATITGSTAGTPGNRSLILKISSTGGSSYYALAGRIYLKTGSTTAETITINKICRYVRVSPSKIKLYDRRASGGTFTVSANTSWTATSDSSWLQIPKALSGSTGSTEITYAIEKNTSTATRNGTINFAFMHSSSLTSGITFNVSQNSSQYLTLKTSSISLTSGATTRSVNLFSDGKFDAKINSQNNDWLKVKSIELPDLENGGTAGKLTFTVTENHTEMLQRSDYIIVTDENGNNRIYLNIYQTAAPFIKVSPSALTISGNYSARTQGTYIAVTANIPFIATGSKEAGWPISSTQTGETASTLTFSSGYRSFYISPYKNTTSMPGETQHFSVYSPASAYGITKTVRVEQTAKPSLAWGNINLSGIRGYYSGYGNSWPGWNVSAITNCNWKVNIPTGMSEWVTTTKASGQSGTTTFQVKIAPNTGNTYQAYRNGYIYLTDGDPYFPEKTGLYIFQRESPKFWGVTLGAKISGKFYESDYTYNITANEGTWGQPKVYLGTMTGKSMFSAVTTLLKNIYKVEPSATTDMKKLNSSGGYGFFASGFTSGSSITSDTIFNNYVLPASGKYGHGTFMADGHNSSSHSFGLCITSGYSPQVPKIISGVSLYQSYKLIYPYGSSSSGTSPSGVKYIDKESGQYTWSYFDMTNDNRKCPSSFKVYSSGKTAPNITCERLGYETFSVPSQNSNIYPTKKTGLVATVGMIESIFPGFVTSNYEERLYYPISAYTSTITDRNAVVTDDFVPNTDKPFLMNTSGGQSYKGWKERSGRTDVVYLMSDITDVSDSSYYQAYGHNTPSGSSAIYSSTRLGICLDQEELSFYSENEMGGGTCDTSCPAQTCLSQFQCPYGLAISFNKHGWATIENLDRCTLCGRCYDSEGYCFYGAVFSPLENYSIIKPISPIPYYILGVSATIVNGILQGNDDFLYVLASLPDTTIIENIDELLLDGEWENVRLYWLAPGPPLSTWQNLGIPLTQTPSILYYKNGKLLKKREEGINQQNLYNDINAFNS